MARKPAHLEARGKLTPRERIWAAIRELKRFTVYALARRVHIDDRTVLSYVSALDLAGYVAVWKQTTVHGQLVELEYELKRDIGIDAPRVNQEGREVTLGRGTLALWRTMRVHRKQYLTARELCSFACTEDLVVAPNTAKTYCQFLARAGYVQVMRPAKRGTPAFYRLAKYTGPKAPQIQRVKHLYDPNLGLVVWHPGADA